MDVKDPPRETAIGDRQAVARSDRIRGVCGQTLGEAYGGTLIRRLQ
jgi:hypothetical protein